MQLTPEEIEVLSDLLIARLQELNKFIASLPVKEKDVLMNHHKFLRNLHTKILESEK
jgi:hypothetical protein